MGQACFGIQDSKVRERLFREKNLSLQKTDEICRAHETMIEQMKVVGGASTGVASSRRSVSQGAAQKTAREKIKKGSATPFLFFRPLFSALRPD